jgi:hypothetical protein
MNRTLPLFVVVSVVASVSPIANGWAGDKASGSARIDADEDEDLSGYTPPSPGPTAVASGYIDVGFADVQGDGSSFAPGDTRVPADYAVDPFATAVNSRGDVANNAAKGFTNGFEPRSVGIGGQPSFLLNTISTDLRVSNANGSYLVFVRGQAFPRFTSNGDQTNVLIEQAFARFLPFSSQELSVTIGKSDSVFGVEYLDNQANLRTGITPSLIARYTTGTQLGAKLFYRVQLPSLWSAISVNTAASNGPTFIDSLQTQSASLSGTPVLSARIGYELNLPRFQIKLGTSGLRGPRNDQHSAAKNMRMWGADARICTAGLSISAEYVNVNEDEGDVAEKLTGQGPAFFASGFAARGFWAQAAWGLPLSWGALEKVTPYVRIGHRKAQFLGFPEVDVARATAGLRLDFAESVAVKGEWLLNRERHGAPDVDNDVRAVSLVFSW